MPKWVQARVSTDSFSRASLFLIHLYTENKTSAGGLSASVRGVLLGSYLAQAPGFAPFPLSMIHVASKVKSQGLKI